MNKRVSHASVCEYVLTENVKESAMLWVLGYVVLLVCVLVIWARACNRLGVN